MKLPHIVQTLIKQPIVLAGVIVLILGAGLLIHNRYEALVTLPWKAQIETRLKQGAEARAQQVSKYLTGVQTELDTFAATALATDAPASNEPRLPGAAEQSLRSRFPELQHVRLVKAGTNYADGNENFVALDMLNAITRGKRPKPAAARTNDVWQILMAAPALADSNVVGGVLATLSVAQLEVVLAKAGADGGRATVQQTPRGFTPQTISSVGTGSPAFSASSPIQGTADWQIIFDAPENLPESVPKSLLVFLAIAVGIVVVTLLLVIILIRYVVRLNDDGGSKTTSPKNGDGVLPTKNNPEQIPETQPSKNSKRRPGNAEVHTPTEQAEIRAETESADAPPLPDKGDDSDDELYPPAVFRSYDIRGDATAQITTAFASALGKTLGSQSLAADNNRLVVAADGRLTSPSLQEALIDGILSTGCHVDNIGRIPTPVFNFGIQHLPGVDSGVIVTASHNPADDNGFKMVVAGDVMGPESITNLATAMKAANWLTGNGQCDQKDVVEAYLSAITDDIALPVSLHVVVDCANGVMGPIAPQLLSTLGCKVTPLYCEIKGDFPYHAPDPSDPGNLQDLIATVKEEGADLGIAFDGDGDRIVAISASGRIVWPDELLMIFARDLLARQPGADIVFDVKSTRRLGELVSSYGGRPIMHKTGHSNIRRKIRETGAPLGGEYSGHIFFSDRWFGFDDGLYAAARLLEIMGLREQGLDDIVASFDVVVATPEIKVPVPDDEKFTLVDQLKKNAVFKHGTLIKVDGLRVEFPDGWGLIRASNTSAALTLRFEAKDEPALSKIQKLFKEQISIVAPDIELPF